MHTQRALESARSGTTDRVEAWVVLCSKKALRSDSCFCEGGFCESIKEVSGKKGALRLTSVKKAEFPFPVYKFQCAQMGLGLSFRFTFNPLPLTRVSDSTPMHKPHAQIPTRRLLSTSGWVALATASLPPCPPT